MPDQLDAAAGGARTGPQEHEHEKEHGEAVAPAGVVGRYKAGGRNDGDDLKNTVPERFFPSQISVVFDNKSNNNAEQNNEKEIGLELVACPYLAELAFQPKVNDRIIGAGKKHKKSDGVLYGRRIVIGHAGIFG